MRKRENGNMLKWENEKTITRENYKTRQRDNEKTRTQENEKTRNGSDSIAYGVVCYDIFDSCAMFSKYLVLMRVVYCGMS